MRKHSKLWVIFTAVLYGLFIGSIFVLGTHGDYKIANAMPAEQVQTFQLSCSSPTNKDIAPGDLVKCIASANTDGTLVLTNCQSQTRIKPTFPFPTIVFATWTPTTASTQVAPTATDTPVRPTATKTSTQTSTNTAIAPTLAPTQTNTPVPPTATKTSTPTRTPVTPSPDPIPATSTPDANPYPAPATSTSQPYPRP